jgi:hypothetical protein
MFYKKEAPNIMTDYASFTLGIPESDSRMKETNETRRQAALFRLLFR